MAGKGVLDSLPIVEELFDDLLRVYINAGSTGEILYNGLFEKLARLGLARA